MHSSLDEHLYEINYSSTSLWCTLLFPILILIIAVMMTRMTKIENGVS
jgi:hypothetical protein